MTTRHAGVPADAAQLPALHELLQSFWSESRLPVAAATAFELALEEVFMNVVHHASCGARVLRVTIALAAADGCVRLTIEDDGPPFDPLSLPAPDVTAGLEERRVGGLGVFLVRQLMDEVSYLRREGVNQLIMTKQVGEAGAG